MALVSRNEYAALKGVSHTAINKAVNKGEIPLVAGKIDAEAPNAWEERRREIAKPEASAPVMLNTKADAERRREQARADITEMEARRIKGELVSVKDVQRALGAMITQVQTKLLLMPSQLGFKLAVTNDVTACERILDGEIRAALTELSQWEPESANAA